MPLLQKLEGACDQAEQPREGQYNKRARPKKGPVFQNTTFGAGTPTTLPYRNVFEKRKITIKNSFKTTREFIPSNGLFQLTEIRDYGVATSSRKRKEKLRVIQTEKIGQPVLLFMPDWKANQSKILFKNFFEGKSKLTTALLIELLQQPKTKIYPNILMCQQI